MQLYTVLHNKRNILWYLPFKKHKSIMLLCKCVHVPSRCFKTKPFYFLQFHAKYDYILNEQQAQS